MKLRGIDLAGFKSFADKTEIRFEDGMTAIVGPNGCGKSNISDAIRWVLGEQGAKALRGKSMTDVIFNGTTQRKSLSYTEVSLIFDNSDHSIDLPYDEVVMTRKITRSGGGVYCLNNEVCRRRDLVDLLHETGIGKDGYSIISQGKVEEIVNAKPIDRRTIFEEAAGIATFKMQKQESESRLARTEENLNLVNATLTELTRQLTPLKKQSEVARDALKLKEQLKIYEVNAYIYQHENAKTKKAEINEKLKALNENVQLRQKELDIANINYSQALEEIGSVDKQIADVHEQILEQTVNLEKYSGETKLIQEKLNYQLEQKARLERELSVLNNQKTSSVQELKLKTEKKEEIENNLRKLRIEENQISARYLEVINKLTQSEGETENSQNSVIEALGKLGDVKATFSKLTADKENLELSTKDISARLEVFNEKYQANTKLEEEERDVFESIQNRCEELAEVVDDIAKEYNNALFTLKRIDNSLPELTSKLSSFESRQTILNQMQSQHNGYGETVKRLLQDTDRDSELKSEMVGVVASLMKVPEEYETAISLSLGGSLKNIITKNEEDAKNLISYLKKRDYGRATFLPITTIKPRRIDETARRSLSMPGVVGIASELVTFASEASNVFEALLGGTIIVENMDVALKLAKEIRFSYRITTLNGDIINPHGSMVGGSKRNDGPNILSREREIKEVTEQVDLLKVEVQKNRELKQSLEIKTTNLKSDLQIQSEAKHKYDILFAKEQEKLNKIVDYNEDYKQDITALQIELDTKNVKLNKTIEDLETIDKLEHSLSKNNQSVSDTISKNQHEFATLKADRDKYSEQMTNVKIKIASFEQERFSLENDISRLSTEVEDENIRFTELSNDVEKINRQVSIYQASIDTAAKNEKYVESEKLLNLSKTKLANIEDHKISLQNTQETSEEQKTTLGAVILKLGEKIYKEEINLNKVDTDIEAYQERIYEEYELTYESSLPFRKEDFNISQGFIEISNIKKEISKLGYINLNAIEDYKVLNERFEGLNSESEDLIKAKLDLNEIIKDLSDEMSARFETTFNIINTNFTKIFKELFNGGKAELKIVESESGDPLQNGVDILAEPPGKKLSSINLLSGGEKALTAIAILFAILKYRSMPFCLLDEIEAALDDANVGRFASYLKRFSAGTQFIVITHRKPTMEQADSMYGVTMQEKGVSSIVSVKLSDIND